MSALPVLTRWGGLLCRKRATAPPTSASRNRWRESRPRDGKRTYALRRARRTQWLCPDWRTSTVARDRQTATSSSRESYMRRSCEPEPCLPLCCHEPRLSSQPDRFCCALSCSRACLFLIAALPRGQVWPPLLWQSTPATILTLVSQAHGSVAAVSQRAYVPRTSTSKAEMGDAR